MGLIAGLLLLFCLFSPSQAQSDPQPVIPSDSLFTTQVYGLPKTNSTAQVLPVSGQPFSRELKVTIGKQSDQTNATQIGMPTSIPVQKGDTLLASFYVRGVAAGGHQPAHMMFLFGQSVDPWTKSVTQGVATGPNPQAWKRVLVPFTAVDTYQPGQATVWLCFAFGPQTIEVGGLAILDYGSSKSLGELEEMVAQDNPLGTAYVSINLSSTKQTLLGFGGDFCQPRFGFSDPLDASGRYNLAHLHVVQARVGIPLNYWTPEKGTYTDSGPAHAAFLLMHLLARRKIPIIGTVWEGPTWMLPGKPEQNQRILPPSEYADCIDAIVRFLTVARDTYGVNIAYFSFNEADYGVNFKFSPREIADFIRRAGPQFRVAGLKTRFLVGDTGGGASLPAYIRPLLDDPSIAPYLGPIAFHCWDVLSTPDEWYAQIAALGRQYHKPIFCTEGGWDSGLWKQPDPWALWENGLNTALAYIRTLRLSGASVMDYWTYEDNYPIVDPKTVKPYPVFYVIKRMQDALPAGAKIVSASADNQDLSVLASAGPKSGQFSVLLANSAGPGTVAIAGLPPHATLKILLSDDKARNEPEPSFKTDAYGGMQLPIPARSVVTIVGQQVANPTFLSRRINISA